MRSRGVAALAALLMLTTAMAAPPRVAVDDRPLDVAAIVQDGRVLVPMRPIFEALGATLRYDAARHIIAADGAGHALRLQIGARNAIVDDRIVTLDVPARVVGASTYVPLRFVAQACGAIVGYDARSGLVTVDRPVPAAGASSQVTGMQPAPGATVASAYPTISGIVASDGRALRDDRLTVDGIDVSANASFDGSTFTYIPQTGLPVGQHTVAFLGTDEAGATYAGSWSFTTTLPPQPDAGSVPLSLSVEGGYAYGYGDPMELVLDAPPGGTAYVLACNSPLRQWMYPDPGDAARYRLFLPAPYGYADGLCPIEAVYIGWNGQVLYAPVPIFIRVAPNPYDYRGRRRDRPHDRPTPHPTPAPTAPPTMRPNPGPSIAPVPHPPRPHPPRTPLDTPEPRPTDAPQPRTTEAPQPRATAAPTPAPTAAPQPPPQPRPHRTPHPRPLPTPSD